MRCLLSILMLFKYNRDNEFFRKCHNGAPLCTGDFNFPKALWDAGMGTVQTDDPCNRKSLQQLIDLASRYNLLQTVTEGTRVTRSGRRNILELIFTNNHELITSVQVEPSKITDHEYIKCDTSYKLSVRGKEDVHDKGTNLSSYNYESANWKNIKAELKKINWPEILAEHESSEEKLKVILEIVIKIIEENCTTFRNQQGSHTNKIPRDRRVLFRKKKMLNKELRKRNPSDRKKRIEKAIGEIDKKLLDSYEEENIVNETRAIEYIKSNPKYFFTYARKKLKTRNKIGPFDMGGEKITSLLEICTKLVEQYSSSFSQPDPEYKIENPTEFFSMNEENAGPLLGDIELSSRKLCVNILISRYIWSLRTIQSA